MIVLVVSHKQSNSFPKQEKEDPELETQDFAAPAELQYFPNLLHHRKSVARSHLLGIEGMPFLDESEIEV